MSEPIVHKGLEGITAAATNIAEVDGQNGRLTLRGYDVSELSGKVTFETKLPLYEQTLKTPEYFLFDPAGGYLKSCLQGYQLENGQHVRLEPKQGRLHSEQLELDFVQIGETLRLYNPASGEFLPTPQEQAERVEAEARRAETEARRAETEARRAEDAEAENTRLRAEIESLKKGQQ